MKNCEGHDSPQPLCLFKASFLFNHGNGRAQKRVKGDVVELVQYSKKLFAYCELYSAVTICGVGAKLMD